MGDPRIHTFLTLIGSVSAVEDGCGNIISILLPNQNLPAMEEHETESLTECEAQINEYLSGARKRFDLPLSYSGTAFFSSVLDALSDIPYGEVRTYSQIAASVDSPRAYRAVGSACASNPLPIVIPCHRVVPSSGGVGNYAGGTTMKKRLLDLEGYRP